MNRRVAGAAGGQTAKDAAGNDVKASKWIETHKAGDHSLVQGLKGDATYLVVTEKNEIEKFGINGEMHTNLLLHAVAQVCCGGRYVMSLYVVIYSCMH